ncbi:conserved hypothetical protein [Ricinus communis]|uniref:Uncharacterized protein n=1 Tax=Ricinus communis TaxID=3988 RepID=B9TH37_RICCO|nr:conserved hypothetical protein [Ricinus communis]
MTIDGGRLVPAGPFDAERLNSYRRGTIVYVRFTEEKDRVLVRKWFAVLGLVLKQCQTPWKNKDEAHEAIKLALGIVNLTKTVGGDFMQYPKSLTDLEDPELQEALDQMIELLSRMTGVDVATLKKETAHVDEEPHDPSTGEILDGEVIPPETTESGAPQPEDADAPPPASAEEAGHPDPVSSPNSEASIPVEAADGAGDPPSSPSGSPDAPETEREILIRFARDVLPMAADTTISPSAAKAVEKEWAAQIKELSEDGIAKARTISESMRLISNSPAKLGGVLERYARELDTTVEELGG